MQAPRRSLLVAVCCTAQFMVILDVAVVNVALPSIRTALGFSANDLQWVVTAYTIAFAGFLILGGRAADLFGQRRTFVAGLLLFALASLAGGVAPSAATLVAARALQGLGGAIMAPASLSIITAAFAAGPERMRAVGLWGAMNGAGGAAGTLLGGVITQELGWRWILLINIPLALAAAAVARVVVDERRRAADGAGFDLAGALSVTAGLAALVWGIVSAGLHGWGSLAALGPIALGLVLLTAFLTVEGRVASGALVPRRVFSDRLLRSANLAVLVFSAAVLPMWYFLSLYLQEVLRFPPIGAGLAFLPMALTIMACAGYADRLVHRFGSGPVLGSGLALTACGMALFARIAVNGGYLSDVVLPSLLAATGIGFSVVSSTIAATATAEQRNAGLASGLVNTSRQIGGALGLAILTALAAGYTQHLEGHDFRAPLVALTDGFRLAFLIGAGFAACGAVIAFRFLPQAARSVAAPPQPPAAKRGASATAQPAGAGGPTAERRASATARHVGAGGSMARSRGAPEGGG